MWKWIYILDNGHGIKNNFNNYNFNRTDNTHNNPQYRPSAPSQGNDFNTYYDPSGTPLAPFESFHSKTPINDNLFNYDNLLRRRPSNGMQSGSYDTSNVPLAPFPGSRVSSYDSSGNVPLAPFPGSTGPIYDSSGNVPLAPFPGQG